MREKKEASSRHHYKPRDFSFAQQLFALRGRSGLTQDVVALQIGVTEKTIRNWEGGSNYPSDAHLQKLIEFYLNQQAFVPGNEENEARTLWDQLWERNPRLKFPFDEQWFATLLKTWQERNAGQAILLDDRRQSSTYAQRGPAIQEVLPSTSPSRLRQGDWSKAFVVSSWYGRADELTQLERWVVPEQCRLVTVLGMGGIGKTALVIKCMLTGGIQL